MIIKTLSGIRMLDQPHGGVFAGRSLLVTGRSGTGKSVAAFQFIHQGLQQEEPCLILSTMAANDLSICAESLGFPFAVPIDNGSLILLEYQAFIPGRGAPDWGPLPPEGFDQLREIIEGHSISRVVLDTVLPWISVTQTDRMARHVFSFVRSCDRLGVTTLMTMPKPVSSMAFRLKKAVEDVVPVSVLLAPEKDTDRFLWQTVKYLGEKNPGKPIPYTIEKNTGLTPVPVKPREDVSAPAEPTEPAATEPEATPPAEPPPAEAPQQPVRYSSVFPASQSGGTARSRERVPEITDPGPARLAKVWKPDLGGSSPGSGSGKR